MLASRGNLYGLEALNREWVERAGSFTPRRPVVLDLDSSESPTYGEQEDSAYNGHFAKFCYHPLFCFNHLGDLEGAMLPEKLIKTGARIVRHARYVTSQMAEVALPRALLKQILAWIARLTSLCGTG